MWYERLPYFWIGSAMAHTRNSCTSFSNKWYWIQRGNLVESFAPIESISVLSDHDVDDEHYGWNSKQHEIRIPFVIHWRIFIIFSSRAIVCLQTHTKKSNSISFFCFFLIYSLPIFNSMSLQFSVLLNTHSKSYI